MKYIFLSKQFYNDYEPVQHPEIIHKKERPYIMLLVTIDGLTFAIPFRSSIKHSYSFITDEINHCGIDYSKAIIITKTIYIDTTRKPHIRQNEHIALFGKKHIILKEFKKYIKNYKRAVKNNVHTSVYVYKISALQYFHKELGLD